VWPAIRISRGVTSGAIKRRPLDDHTIASNIGRVSARRPIALTTTSNVDDVTRCGYTVSRFSTAVEVIRFCRGALIYGATSPTDDPGSTRCEHARINLAGRLNALAYIERNTAHCTSWMRTARPGALWDMRPINIISRWTSSFLPSSACSLHVQLRVPSALF